MSRKKYQARSEIDASASWEEKFARASWGRGYGSPVWAVASVSNAERSDAFKQLVTDLRTNGSFSKFLQRGFAEFLAEHTSSTLFGKSLESLSANEIETRLVNGNFLNRLADELERGYESARLLVADLVTQAVNRGDTEFLRDVADGIEQLSHQIETPNDYADPVLRIVLWHAKEIEDKSGRVTAPELHEAVCADKALPQGIDISDLRRICKQFGIHLTAAKSGRKKV